MGIILTVCICVVAGISTLKPTHDKIDIWISRSEYGKLDTFLSSQAFSTKQASSNDLSYYCLIETLETNFSMFEKHGLAFLSSAVQEESLRFRVLDIYTKNAVNNPKYAFSLLSNYKHFPAGSNKPVSATLASYSPGFVDSLFVCLFKSKGITINTPASLIISTVIPYMRLALEEYPKVKKIIEYTKTLDEFIELKKGFDKGLTALIAFKENVEKALNYSDYSGLDEEQLNQMIELTEYLYKLNTLFGSGNNEFHPGQLREYYSIEDYSSLETESDQLNRMIKAADNSINECTKGNKIVHDKSAIVKSDLINLLND